MPYEFEYDPDLLIPTIKPSTANPTQKNSLSCTLYQIKVHGK